MNPINFNPEDINFDKSGGLIPVIVQDAVSCQVLMLGYMNREALQQTLQSDHVIFYSRSKARLWEKGESSGNFLSWKSMYLDCDRDTLLIRAIPKGPTCHTGNDSCFDLDKADGFIYRLGATISEKIDKNEATSYTNSLYRRGINKVAQKVGEEAVELIIEAKDNNEALFLNEAADLLYHYLVLLKAKGYALSDVEEVLRSRSVSE